MATTIRDRRLDTIGVLGDMEYLNASGLWVPVGLVKATGKVPTIQADGTIGWQAPGGAGSVFLGEVVAAAAADAPFTSLIGATYDDYCLAWDSLVPGTSTALVGIQFSTTNGSSWITSGYEYGGANYGVTTNFSAYARGTSIAVASLCVGGLGTTVKSHGVTDLFAANTSESKIIFSRGMLGASDGNAYSFVNGARYATATTFNAIRVIATSGTITGKFRLYGLAKV